MGTRATYQIEGKTFYCHWDNYPEGAAYRLFKMLANDSKGGLACRFLRANEDAEFTESHDAHGDTEFQYTVDTKFNPTGHALMIDVKARSPFGEWGKSAYMQLSEFLLIESKKGNFKLEACSPTGKLPHQVQESIDEFTKGVGEWILSGKNAQGHLQPVYDELIADMQWLRDTYGYHYSLVGDRLCNAPKIDLSLYEFLNDLHRDKKVWQEIINQVKAA